MLNRRCLLALGSGAIALLLTVACSPTASVRNNSDQGGSNSPEYRLGVAVAQTGNVSLLGQEQVIGAKMAAELLNKGTKATPIELVFQDTAGDEQGAINAFTTLINQDKVLGIVGPSLSQQGFAADPIAERAGVPVLAPSNTAKGIPQIGEFVARVSAPVAVVAPKALDAALKLNPQIKTVAVFFAQNDAFSKSETGTFQEAVKAKKLKLATVQKFQTTDTDFQTQATAALNLKPDLVIISGLAADGGNLVKQLRELGYKGLIIGGNGLNTANIFPVCQAACDGVIIAQAYGPELDSPMNKQFKAAYKAQTGKDQPPQFTAQTFAAVQVFTEALRTLSDANPGFSQLPLAEQRKQLNAQVLKGSYETPLGKLAFTPEGEIIQERFYVAQINMEPNGTTGRFAFLP